MIKKIHINFYNYNKQFQDTYSGYWKADQSYSPKNLDFMPFMARRSDYRRDLFRLLEERLGL